MNNDDLISELESISNRLSERAISVLRDALGGDDPSRPDQEKKLTQARRAVEKALHLLRGITGDYQFH
ncbi:MAG: hypothetical protein EXQ63_00625 [Ilumatobacteraceae bacterium]|nr:hypothetical protein [Ilumatobacteraceae bacterium]